MESQNGDMSEGEPLMINSPRRYEATTTIMTENQEELIRRLPSYERNMTKSMPPRT